ncbi:hypothetical protein NLI96_g6270 [Meripilus lineatus]|uniref:Uncharacterized protein n=1 Tax=Meripilus lineatus TaxID=2056292 RepID=A0AAD5YI82_9APHY|nr:hypothetical protein NLI96_g6270 [Physisporinus lineatus]
MSAGNSLGSHITKRESLVPELNYDIVSYIMASCPRGDVSSLMKTCHAYYSIGVPILLRPSDGFHKGSKSFYDFMFATSPGPPDRFRYLLDLEARFDPNKPETLIIPRLLLRAMNLERLSIHGADELMEFYPHVADSLTKLTEFRCWSVDTPGTGAIEWLKRTTAPIARLQVVLFIDNNTSPVLDILPAILKFADTLVSLELVNALVGPNTSGILFLKVREIKILMYHVFGYLTPGQNIIQSFPNLEVLHVDILEMYEEEEGDGDEEAMDREHDFNVGEVTRLGVPTRPLKELQGNIISLYRGGYCSNWPVEKLTVDDIRCKPEFHMFLPIFDLIRPRVLSLNISYEIADINDYLSLAFEAVSRVGTVEDLRLNFWFHFDYFFNPGTDASTYSDYIVPVVDDFLSELSMPLELLSDTIKRLTLRCHTDSWDLDVGLIEVDAPAAGSLYFETIPSLESITFELPQMVDVTEGGRVRCKRHEETYTRKEETPRVELMG